MREILFKAKTKLIVGTYNSGKEDGEWVKGSLLVDIGKYLIRHFEFDRHDYVDYEVDPETVCQYTGLTDKNGKKIFEGDIIDYEDEAPGQYEYHDSLIINRGVIEYSEGCFYWTNAVNANLLDSVYKGVADCEVIGNIFDNPELLTIED